ncbi:hypothetical protein FOZ62_018242, partial [Perkinsus olseni]
GACVSQSAMPSFLRKLSFLKCGKMSKKDRRCSVPLVSSSKKEGADFVVDGVEIECGNCRASTRIPEGANNFLCESCKSVNRVTVYPLGDRGVDVVEEPSCTVPRQRGANHGLQLAGDS